MFNKGTPVYPVPSTDDDSNIEVSFKKAHWKLIQMFLDLAVDEMGNAGCNDFVMPLTSTYLELAKEANPEDSDFYEEQLEGQLPLPFSEKDKDKIQPLYCMDISIASHLLAVLREKTGISPKQEGPFYIEE